MVVGWPMFIMSLVILAGLDGQLNKGIVMTDAYDMVNGGCLILSVSDNITFPNSGQDKFGLTLVKYQLFDGDLIGVGVYNGTNPYQDYYQTNDVISCWENRETSQILLEDTPYVGWLRRPMRRGTCIILIVVSCLLICAPCTIACFVMCSQS